MKKIVVSASSMPAGRNMSSQLDYIAKVENYGADMYHFDVMDGVFVKNKTIDFAYLEQLQEKTSMLFDVHLMVSNPISVVDKYLKVNSGIISVHYEAVEDKEKLIKLLKKIKKHKRLAGLAIDLDTKIEVLDELIKYVDLVLIMCVKAGKGGQAFNKDAIKKIKHVRQLSSKVLIEADGGINKETGAMCVRAGADILACGSFIYNNDTYEAIQQLKGRSN